MLTSWECRPWCACVFREPSGGRNSIETRGFDAIIKVRPALGSAQRAVEGPSWRAAGAGAALQQALVCNLC